MVWKIFISIPAIYLTGSAPAFLAWFSGETRANSRDMAVIKVNQDRRNFSYMDITGSRQNYGGAQLSVHAY